MKMMSANELKDKIVAVYAVELKKGFRIDAELESGEIVNIKGKSTRKPEKVQLYDAIVNHNATPGSHGVVFTFAKTILAFHRKSHLKTYTVK